MTQTEWILSRMEELDDWRWNGMISEAEYQELTAFWRRTLPALHPRSEADILQGRPSWLGPFPSPENDT